MDYEAATITDTTSTAYLPYLQLDQPRRIGLTIGGSPVTFEFRVIDAKTWRMFMERIVNRVERVEGQQYEINDEQAALIDLYAATIVHAHPYADDALKRVPLRYQAAAASVLRAVAASTVESDTATEFIEVKLQAAWSMGDDGKMRMFDGLVHRFRQPTIDQYRRFRMGVARLLVTGDAQNGATTYPSRLAVALGLYDELIAEVEGYAYEGVSLDSCAIMEVARYMDAMHKARAVLEMFERGEEDISVGTGKPQADNADGATE